MQAVIPFDRIFSGGIGAAAGLSETAQGWILVLIGLIVFIIVMWIVNRLKRVAKAPAEAAQAPAEAQPISENRGELAAVIAACIASDMNVMPEGLRILSIRKKN